jgi:hypothetical protein
LFHIFLYDCSSKLTYNHANNYGTDQVIIGHTIFKDATIFDGTYLSFPSAFEFKILAKERGNEHKYFGETQLTLIYYAPHQQKHVNACTNPVAWLRSVVIVKEYMVAGLHASCKFATLRQEQHYHFSISVGQIK